MYQMPARGKVLEVFLFSVSSILLYAFGLRGLLFLIPLQILMTRRGIQGLAGACGLTFLFILGYGAFQYSAVYGRGGVAAMRVTIEILPAMALLLGLIVVNLPFLQRYRGLVRLLAATGGVGVLAVPLLLSAPQIPAYGKAVTAIFSDVASALQAYLAPVVPSSGSPIVDLLDPTSLQAAFVPIILSRFLLFYFIVLLFGWWAGRQIAGRTRAMIPVSVERPARLSEFRLQSFYLWPLIVAGAFILLDQVVDIPIVPYVAWNVGSVVFFLFGIQGMAIIKFFFEKHRLPRLLWGMLLVLLALVLVTPEVSIFFMIAIPAFGVSENWIRLRVPAKAVD